MEQPQRPRSDSSPLSSLNTSPSPSPHYATNDNVPELLERSTLRLSDVERIEEGIAGEGVLVKLFPVKRKGIRSIHDSIQTLWIVRAHKADSMVVDKLENAQGARARASQMAKAGAVSSRRPKAKVTGGEAGSWKGRRLRGKGEGGHVTTGGRGQEDRGRLGGASDEEEDEAEEGEEEEDEEPGAEDEDEDETDAEEHDAEEEDEDEEDEEDEDEDEAEGDGDDEGDEEHGTEKHGAEAHVAEELIAAGKNEGKQDAEEQDEDEHNSEDEEDQAEEADEEERGEGEGGVDEEKGEVEAAGEKAHGHANARGRESPDKDEQEKEKEYGEKADGEKGNRDKGREDIEAMKPRVAADNQVGARRDGRVGETDDEEGEEKNTDSGEEERMAGEEDGSPKKERKRLFERSDAFECSTPEDRPNKRNKSDGGESDDGAATDDSPKRTTGLEITPRPKTSSPTSTTASPGSILEIVRQTSVVPGLENTEKAVWDAAQRDGIINSLPREQQTKIIHTALSLGSEEGIKELQRFVYNARKDSTQGSESLVSDSQLIAPRPGLDIGHANGVMVSRDSGLVHFSALYQHLDILDGKTTLFSIAKRAKLAAMAQYRKSLLPEGAGKKQVRGATLCLFRAVWPHHDTIEKPEDKATNPAACADWIRLRDRLKEGKQWLAVRDLFGGDGAFLALPPQCVSDRDILKMPTEVLRAWLGLLEVAWKALDDRARQTKNTLVRLALAGQRFPEEVLALEILESGTGTTPTSLSAMFTGWSAAARNFQDNEDGVLATLTERETYGNVTAPETLSTTARITSRTKEASDADVILQKETMGDVGDGLFDDLYFDDRLSQEI